MSKKYTRWLQLHVLFVKIGDLHREILAEIETHVDDGKCLREKSNEKCLCQKKERDTWILQSIRRRKAREKITFEGQV